MNSVLVVDAANVVGSVPDGWWRDRAAAARRLVDRLDPATLGYDHVVVVLEGQARVGVPETPAGDTSPTAGPDAGVRVVHAAGPGDDELVAQCRTWLLLGCRVSLATADRGLIARVPDVAIVGPRSVR